jgi:hypothetical protein
VKRKVPGAQEAVESEAARALRSAELDKTHALRSAEVPPLWIPIRKPQPYHLTATLSSNRNPTR